MEHDLIAAIATAAPGAVGIVRMSGNGAIAALDKVFIPKRGGKISSCAPQTMVYGTVYDVTGAGIDHALATFSRAPLSYTGEDTAEIHCHGGSMILAMVLESLFAHGCRQAQAGEFTKRAFLNGKLDLMQAESVVDLIDAESAEAVRHAAGKLGGAMTRRTDEIYSALAYLSAHFCAALDYPDEDIDPFTAEKMAQTIAQQEDALSQMLSTWQRGKHLFHGIPCAIVGPPNAGKSSLLNAILGYERAIVTPIAGTTRDTVEERANIGDITLRFIDTAGVRDSNDPVEQIGVTRTRDAMASAQLILLLHECTLPLSQDELLLQQQSAALAPTILVYTKCDLLESLPKTQQDSPSTVYLSAKTGAGLDALSRAIEKSLPQGNHAAYGEVLTSARQADAAARALSHLQHARLALTQGMTPDAVLADVELSMLALGELTGRNLRDDITDTIFKRFCVGK